MALLQKPQVFDAKPWRPDLPPLNDDSASNVRNLFPRSSKAYGAVPALARYSGNALNSRCQGAGAYLDPSGNVNLFAGSATDLFNLVAGSNNFVNISKSAGAYGISPTDQWNFAYYNGRVLATEIANPIQSFTPGVSTKFADLAAAAPKARYIATIKSFVMVANTNDPVSGLAPQRAWWCANNDPTNWPTPGSAAAIAVQSSYNDLTNDWGWCQGIVGNLGNADGALFMEHGVWRIVYAGPPDIFDFLPAQGAKGCPAPGSIVHVGNIAYFLGEDGFYAFDGINVDPIGMDNVDLTFFADLDASNIALVVGSLDPVRKLIRWAYPGAGNQGIPNHIINYHYLLRRWSIIDESVETIARMLTIGYTLDELYTILGYTIDNLPAPLDSRMWTGGTSNLGFFDSSHYLNLETGPNLAATFESSEVTPFLGSRTKVMGARPYVDGGTPSIAIGHRETQQQPVTYAQAQPLNAFGTAPARTSGRYIRGKLTTRSGDTWTNLYGMELDVSPGGLR